MSRVVVDGCGCFPTGRHYAGIAHLLRTAARGLVDIFPADAAWIDLPVALLDVETTGRDASVDRVIEVGIAILANGEVVSKGNWLINPGMPIPAEASAVHHITDDVVKDSPRFEAVAAEIVAALEGTIPAAYNAPFDRAFLLNELARAGVAPPASLRRDIEWVDPLVWAREVQHDERSKSLGEVATRLGIDLTNAHRASDDAAAALKVLYALAKDPRVPRQYGPLIQEQKRLSLIHADERRRWTRPS